MKYKPKKKFMEEAIKIAKKEHKNHGEWIFGAVIIRKGEIIAKSGNRVFRDIDPSAHAEISAMRKAAKKLKTKYLHDCILYTTNEPCAMCTSAAVWAEMKGIVFGANIKDLEKKFKKEKNPMKFFIPTGKILKEQKSKSKRPFLIKNFLRSECLELLKD